MRCYIVFKCDSAIASNVIHHNVYSKLLKDKSDPPSVVYRESSGKYVRIKPTNFQLYRLSNEVAYTVFNRLPYLSKNKNIPTQIEYFQKYPEDFI